MDKDDKIPKGWVVPEDMTNEVSKELNNRRIQPEEMLQDSLSDIAWDITIFEPDPKDWG